MRVDDKYYGGRLTDKEIARLNKEAVIDMQKQKERTAKLMAAFRPAE